MSEAVIYGTGHGEGLGKAAALNLSGRIPELDGIRGIAIGMVLLRHFFLDLLHPAFKTPLAYSLVPFRLAWTGVDLFFVLSGFLIGGILMDARGSSNYFGVFYARRFFRIVPIYALTLVCFYALNALVHFGLLPRLAWMMRFQLPWYSYVLFAQNFWMVARNSLGAYGLGITWSLAIEEQFYLTLPLLVRLLNPQRLAKFLIAGVLLAPVLRIVSYLLWPGHILSWFALMPCRMDALLLGALGAMAIRNPRFREFLAGKERAFLSLLVVLAGGFVVLTLRFPSQFDRGMFSVGYTWLAVFYLGVLLYALSHPGSRLSGVLRWSGLVWLGTIAYAAYLYHETTSALVFTFLRSHSPRIDSLADFFTSVAAVSLALVLAWASWVFFEKPLVNLGHRWKYRFAETSNGEPGLPLAVAAGERSV